MRRHTASALAGLLLAPWLVLSGLFGVPACCDSACPMQHANAATPAMNMAGMNMPGTKIDCPTPHAPTTCCNGRLAQQPPPALSPSRPLSPPLASPTMDPSLAAARLGAVPSVPPRAGFPPRLDRPPSFGA